MNEGEDSPVNVCQEKDSEDVLEKQNHEFVTPVRRSVRIKKSKISDEDTSKVVNTSLISNKHVTTNVNCSPSTVSTIDKNLETSDTFSQTHDGEEESIQAMFDDIFEQRCSRTVQSLLPKNLSDDSVKERNFFKRETPILNVCYRTNLPAEDVSKVFKIISKPNPLPDLIDAKSTPKPLLKTYSNKRKLCKKSNVIESFGLPDHPIASGNVQPLLNDDLDVTIEDANDITILESEYIEEPWIITAEGEEFFPFVDEIRTKSEPIHYPFKKNGSFLDFADSFETFIEPTIFTSSPFNSEVCGDDSSALKGTGHRNKEIDIEAIKINFKKILSRTDVTETQKSVAVKKPSNSSTKRNAVISANTDILFLEDDSLTIDNKEFEFTNNLAVPKSDSLGVSDKTEKKTTNDHSILNQDESKIVKRILRSSANNDEKKAEELEANKNKSKKQTLPENEITNTDAENVPKKASKTDSTLKCNFHVGNKEDHQKDAKETNKMISESSSFDKRKLRSSSQSRSLRGEENSTNKTDNEKRSETKKLETVTKKSSISHTKLEQKISEAAVNKRTLRSASQERMIQEKPPNELNDAVEKINRQSNKIMSVSLQKCKLNDGTDSTSNTQETLQENKGRDKLLSPLKSDRRSLPEITIILNPLDVVKLNEKLPEHSKIPVYHMTSSTSRKLRLTKPDPRGELFKQTIVNDLEMAKTKKKDSKTKGDKPGGTKSNVNKNKSKSLTSIDSLTISGKDSVEKPRKKHHSICSDIGIDVNKPEFITGVAKEVFKNKEAKNPSTNQQEIDETTYPFPDMEVNLSKTATTERLRETEQSIETTVNQAQKEDEKVNYKCDQEVQHTINPLDMAELTDKLAEHSKIPVYDLMSPTTRKLRSTKTTSLQKTDKTAETNNKNKKDPLGTELDPTKSKKRDIKTKGDKPEEAKSKVSSKSKIKPKSVTSFKDSVGKPTNEHHSLYSEFITTITKAELQNTDAEKNGTAIDKIISCEGQMGTEKNLNSPKTTNPESIHDAEQSVETITQSEEKDDNVNLKCDEQNLNFSKCKSQLEENEKLKNDHLLSETTKIFLHSRKKNNTLDDCSPKVEGTSFPQLLEKEEEKAIISSTMIDKVLSATYLEKTKLIHLDIGEIILEEYKTTDVLSDSECEKTETDIKLKTSPSVNPPEDTEAKSENNIELQEMAEKPQPQVSGNPSESPIATQQDATDKIEETILEVRPPSQIESESKLNSDQKSNEETHDSKIDTNNKALTRNRNETAEQPEKSGKQSGFNARLKEKRRKLLGSKALSAEDSIKRRLSNEIHPPKIQENTTVIGNPCSASTEEPIPVARKRGRPRKSENVASPQKTRPRGRPPRRKSLDDMDLLLRYNEYRKERIIRSKSVAPSTVESRRRQNSQGGTDLLNPCKEHVKDNLKNKTSKIDDLMNDSTNPTPKTNNSRDHFEGKMGVDAKKISNTKKIKSWGNSSSPVKGSANFREGDVAWAQIGCHPYWPCLITKELGTKRFKKTFQGKRFQREFYHVRFFGDKGRRAWIKKQQIMLYSNREDLKSLKDKFKQENKHIPPGFVIKTNVLNKWEGAVEEAEQIKSRNVKEKLLFFTELFTNVQKKESVTAVPKSPPSLAKRKSDENNKTPSSPTKKNNDEKTKKTNKKKAHPENKQNTEETSNKEEITDEVNQIEDSIQQTENILNKMILRQQMDETSEIDSKTSSDNIADSDTSLNSMENQKALYKRNNLFKGISRDKVCQYCFKPGDVLKCRGPCNGSYHVSCSLKILQEKTPRKKRERATKDKNITTHKKAETIDKKADMSSPSLSTEVTLQDEKVDDKHTEEKNGDKSPLTEQDHVQIITVCSGVFNTPPRKTFPPNFKNMTLAEQIDYKMKEIMRKFEAKTFYSCVEPNSEEHLGNPVLIQSDRLNASFLSAKKTIEKDNLMFSKPTALVLPARKVEDKTIQESLKTDINKKLEFPKPNKTLKPTESVDKPNQAAKKTFFKHVTADCDIIKVEAAPKEKSNSVEDNSEVDPKHFKCGFCTSDLYPYCFICHLAVSNKGSNIRQKCSIYPCGRFYHPECLKMWPQTQWSLIQTTRHKESDKDMDSFVCPLHVCHTCVSDDPRAATARCSGDKIVKCLRCPSTYHSSNLCVPAGTKILSSSQIICPRHRDKQHTINTTWCFLCSEGGNLICCETCPTSVHPECLPVNLTDDDKFICEDCESGRLPLYDEIVWVKLGKFRWWPALILFPNEVPDNVRNIKHSIGEFVVKFFGTYDYYWVNKGRSFLFQEGDTGQCNSVRRKVDAAFNRAVEEAVVAHKLKKEFKLSQEVESITSLKPPPYIRIKVNKPVGNVRHLDLDLSSTNACECDPNKPHPCGPESDCLNRLLLTECNPEVCPAGTRCKNQSFEKREYPPLLPYKTQSRGWGLKTLAPIKKGQFVIEYVGELIDSEEYQRRIQKMHAQKEENYYFLTIDKDRMIDAGPKGNAARFMNHCCQPNCETQKWTVNGDTRVGLFATEEIPADTELTFNYNLECVGKEKKVCRCGAPNCSGFIGVKAKQEGDLRKSKKHIKKKVPAEPVILPPCFVCGKNGLVISCNNKMCNKTYHQKCLKTTRQIEGNKFVCPWHNCSTCSKRTIRCCVKCINSYCPSHSDGNIRYDNLLGFVCTAHDPMTPPNDAQPVYKKVKSDVITEETAVTSTTSEVDEEEEDWMPLLMRYKRHGVKRAASVDSESDTDSHVNQSSASQKERFVFSDYESQDEGAVSSATGDERVGVKRKRGRPRKHGRVKKIRLGNEGNSGITASCSVVENRLKSHCSSELTSKTNNLENR